MNRTSAFAFIALVTAAGLANGQSASVPTQERKVTVMTGYSCEDFTYPAAALRKGAQGIVRIKFTANSDGSISDVEVIQSAGETREHKLLDLVSKRRIESCKLTEKGTPLEVRTHEVEFRWAMH